jgi:hypothetical protein
MSFGGPDRFMAKKLADLFDWYVSEQQFGRKCVAQPM